MLVSPSKFSSYIPNASSGRQRQFANWIGPGSPVAKVPSDLLREIFMFALLSTPLTKRPQRAGRLSRVCWTWHGIISHIPGVIRINKPDEGHLNLVVQWLKSPSRPTRFTFCWTVDLNSTYTSIPQRASLDEELILEFNTERTLTQRRPLASKDQTLDPQTVKAIRDTLISQKNNIEQLLLDKDVYLFEGLDGLLHESMDQLKTLRFWPTHCKEKTTTFFPLSGLRMPHLERLMVSSCIISDTKEYKFSHLRQLVIHSFQHPQWTFLRFMNLLRGAPQLEDLDVEGDFFFSNTVDDVIPKFTLPHLRRVSASWVKKNLSPGKPLKFLDVVHLPNLQSIIWTSHKYSPLPVAVSLPPVPYIDKITTMIISPSPIQWTAEIEFPFVIRVPDWLLLHQFPSVKTLVVTEDSSNRPILGIRAMFPTLAVINIVPSCYPSFKYAMDSSTILQSPSLDRQKNDKFEGIPTFRWGWVPTTWMTPRGDND